MANGTIERIRKARERQDLMLQQKRAGMSAEEIATFHGIKAYNNVYGKIRKAEAREAAMSEVTQTNG